MTKCAFYGLCIQILFGTMLIASSGEAQNKSLEEIFLSVQLNDVQLVNLFSELENSTKFNFSYNDSQIDENQKLSLEVKNESFFKVLRVISKKTGLSFKRIDNNIFVRMKQDDGEAVEEEIEMTIIADIEISGKVTDENGEGLPGASVIETGTTNGTTSDLEGNYRLSLSEGATIAISFVGYKTQNILVGTQSAIDIQMEVDAEQLEEIVVVGFGTMKKSDLTGSVVTADIESFRQTSNVSIAQSLQGAVPGLNVGATTTQGAQPTMSIRGLNTLGGATSPLIVLDDVIFRGRMTSINPNDIESVTVLKDASSTAIYGSQAANGVIIITTKRAESTSKPIFSYSGKNSFQTPTKSWTPMNREQFLQKNKDVWWRQAYTEESGYLQPNPDYNDADALVTLHQVEGLNDGTDTDWRESATRTGIIIDNTVNMQTRGKYSSTYMSLGHTDSKGYVQNDNFKRLSARLNVDYDIFDWLRAGVQTFMTVSDYKGQATSLGDILLKSPLSKSHNEDGSLFLFPDGFLTPLFFQDTEQVDKYTTFYGNFYVDMEVPFVKNLKYKLNYTPDYRQHRLYTYNPHGNSDTGEAQKQHWNDFDYQINHRINYRKFFLEKHSIDLTLASGREKITEDYTSALSGEFALQGLDWNRLQDGSVEKQSTTTGAEQETSVYYMGRLVYNYDDRYLLTGTLRRDGFSGFGANNKFAQFPSLAFGWKFTEEKFLKDKVSWLNDGKLRLSYGENGNRSVSRYQTLAQMTSAFGYTFGGNSAFTQTTSTLGNHNLKWETTSSLNLGLDLSVVNSRINGVVEFYSTKTNDMLFPVALPNLGGISSTFTNLGEMKNKGLEITLNTINVQSDNFSWNSTITYSRNRNKIVSLLGKDDNGDGIEDDLISSGLFIGESRSAIYTYNILGLYQLGDNNIPSNSGPGLYKYEDISGPSGEPDGVISSQDDRKIIGYSDPSYRFSIKNILTWKNFSLMILLNSIQGGKNNYVGAITGPTGDQRDDLARKNNFGVEHSQYWWTPQNPNSQFKELFNDDPVQNNRYFQRNFVRLQDVSLAYKFNSTLLEKLNIQDLNIFISGKNLYTWTDWYGLDPETGDGFMTAYPLLKSYTFGINLSF
ncbi:TonB-dependent receptor [Reichenbachiella sp. MALMAid0571]|uniref:TonB-dependent receptor n=1 Tax=Reichenbachiella sp. MALMAid0571 TaxID=3143939 RepID=UPI0032DE3083